MKKGMILIMIFLLLPCMAAVAQEAQASVSYDGRTGRLLVTGTCGTAAETAVYIFILPAREPLSGLSDSNPPAAFGAAATVDGGSYQAEILLPEALEGGKYRVYASAKEGAASAYFMHTNKTEAEAVWRVANAAQSKQELGQVLEEHAEKIGLDPQLFQKDGAFLTEMTYLQRPAQGFSTVQDFLDQATLAGTASALRLGGAVADTLLAPRSLLTVTDSQGNLLIDCYADYEALEDGAKAAFLTWFNKSGLLSGRPLALLVRESCIMASFQTAGHWTGVKNTILGTNAAGEAVCNNFRVLSPDTAYYDRLTYQERVFQALYQRKSQLSSCAALVSQFEALAKEEFEREGKQSASGNGGGAGPVSRSEGSTPQLTPSPTPSFRDMEGHWAQREVARLAERGVVSGFPDGSFRPDEKVSRAEFVKLIAVAFDLPRGSAPEFADVGADDWFAEYVGAASAAGMVTGDENRRFMPGEPVTRQDAAVILYRCMGGAAEAGKVTFSDSGDISDYAGEAVGSLAAAGLVKGTGRNRFAPLECATRAQAAVMISNVLDFLAAQ